METILKNDHIVSNIDLMWEGKNIRVSPITECFLEKIHSIALVWGIINAFIKRFIRFL